MESIIVEMVRLRLGRFFFISFSFLFFMPYLFRFIAREGKRRGEEQQIRHSTYRCLLRTYLCAIWLDL